MIPYIDLGAQYRSLKPEIDEAISRVMASGRYVNGEETEKFEESIAKYLGVKYAIGVGNGYDALFLAIKSLPLIGGDVLTDEYTHVSTFAAIVHASWNRLVYHPSDLTSKKRLHVPVHMNGRVNDEVFADYGVPIIEDACQALGASFNGDKAGTFGIMGCFSLHPMKVLGCAGDGGFIATNDRDLNDKIRLLRNHGGGKGFGYNSRLDNLQAAILNVKLPHLDGWINRRRQIAAIYDDELPEWVKKPPAPSQGPYFDVYSSYVIGGSPGFLAHMRFKGIECFSHVRTDIVSLPIYAEMPDSDIDQVIQAVRSYG